MVRRVLSVDPDQMPHMAKHACQRRSVRVLRRAADLAEPERAQRAFVALALPDGAAHLRDFYLRHAVGSSPLGSAEWLRGGVPWSSTPDSGASGELGETGPGFTLVSGSAAAEAETGRTARMLRPRSRATSSGRRSRFRPTTVAFAMLIGLVVPRLFASTSRIPASSSTARTPPPAITP